MNSNALRRLCAQYGITVSQGAHGFRFSANDQSLEIAAGGGHPPALPETLFALYPGKIAAYAASRLGLNKRVFARNTDVQRLSAADAFTFQESYHLMGAGGGFIHYGLLHGKELLCCASFSKGRKMHRLPGDKRSFEMVRFCCKAGITVTGGLTRLLAAFYRDQKPGDVMTYIDKGWASTKSYTAVGFRIEGETAPSYFLLDRQTGDRIAWDGKSTYNERKFEGVVTAGNYKLILPF